jgi:hypothetical protein
MELNYDNKDSVAKPMCCSVPRKEYMGQQSKPTNSWVNVQHRVDTNETRAGLLAFQSTVKCTLFTRWCIWALQDLG